ncbi:MAG: hypothetical protein ACOZNI_04690 [Myxococcota bacterium]
MTSTADPGEGGCTKGECTLREALVAANATPEADEVVFGARARGAIALRSALPPIASPLVLDGARDDGTPGVDLARGAAPLDASGLVFAAGSEGSVLRGLVVRGFGRSGVVVASADVTVEACWIGTDANGEGADGNGVGIAVEGPGGARVGGPEASRRNVLSGNRVGLQITSSGGNVVVGNYVGTDAGGLRALPNGIGLLIVDAPDNVVGGELLEEANVVSGNTLVGIWIQGPHATGNVVVANLVGLDADGREPLGNAVGVRVDAGASGTLVGSDDSLSPGNFVAGNGTGVVIEANDNVVAGNAVGVRVDGTRVGNAGPGVVIVGRGNRVARNRVEGSGGDGIVVLAGGRNTLSRNAIAGSGALGIDLYDNGATPNDPGDGDHGANDGQNHPVLDAVAPGSRRVAGSLDLAPSTRVRVEVFESESCDPDGTGEGFVFLGETTVEASRRGETRFAATLRSPLPGRALTATATDLDTGATSEFSPCVKVPEARAASLGGVGPIRRQGFTSPSATMLLLSASLALAGPCADLDSTPRRTGRRSRRSSRSR